MCRHPCFTREFFNAYDEPAKVIAKSYLRQAGYTVVDETEAYGSHDFIVERDGIRKKVEVEMKLGWKGDVFQYSTHDVSCRKKTSNADLFIQTNARGTAIAVCDMSVVLCSPVVLKNCRLSDGRMTFNEPFFAVPISQVRYYFYQDNSWYEEDD
jgi:Holliday junction resolvase-like predicted endonuclease